MRYYQLRGDIGAFAGCSINDEEIHEFDDDKTPNEMEAWDWAMDYYQVEGYWVEVDEDGQEI